MPKTWTKQEYVCACGRTYYATANNHNRRNSPQDHCPDCQYHAKVERQRRRRLGWLSLTARFQVLSEDFDEGCDMTLYGIKTFVNLGIFTDGDRFIGERFVLEVKNNYLIIESEMGS
jgi:hypothetical protein